MRALPIRALALLACSILVAACGAARSAVNASPELRWWLFSNFGAERMCPEMLKRGAPLKLAPGANTVGRYFPERCATHVNEANRTVTVQFGGSGFAWTPVAGRVNFRAQAAIEYRMDFYLSEDATYIWAKPQALLSGPSFEVQSIENQVVDWAARTPVGYLASTFGNQIVSSKLAEGFTVVRTDDGDEFSLGYLAPPARPPKPFKTEKGKRLVYANDTAEVQHNQVDFVGPFEVVDNDQALFLRMVARGPAVDVMIFRRGAVDLWRSSLALGAPLTPPTEGPVTGFPLKPNVEARQRLPLMPGEYYVVLDNSDKVGMVAPPFNLLGTLGANVAAVSYAVELGARDDSF